MRICRTTPFALAALLVATSARRAGADAAASAARTSLESECRAIETSLATAHTSKQLAALGLCKIRLERDGEAIEAYSRYLDEEPALLPAERERISKDLQTLSAGLARLTVEADRPGVAITDVRVPVRGDRVANDYGPLDGPTELGVRPGHHIVTAKLAGYDDAVWELEVFPAARDHHAFSMRPPGSGPRPPRHRGAATIYGPWVVMGLGGAALGAGGINGIASADLNNPGLDTTTLFLVGGGGVVLVAGFVWFLLGRESPPPAGISSPSASLACAPTGCQGSLRFAF